MSIYLELHCDIRSQGPHDPGRLEPFCASARNESPHAMAEMASDVPRRIKWLHATAMERGWRLTSDGWACLDCARFRAATAKPSRPLLPIGDEP